MDNSKMEKELHRALKREEKNAKQREKRRLQPNGGRGYGIFKKERLFHEPNKPASSSQLPKKPRVNRVEKRIMQKSKESQTSGCEENSCMQSQGM